MSPTDKTKLLKRIAELERENATLKSELGACQQRVAEIEKPDRLLAATAKATKALVRIENSDEAVNTALQIIGEGWDCDRIGTTENEQIKSAQERAAELAKANIAMRRSIDWLARDPDLNAFLGHLLEEIANQFGVQNAQIFLYDERERTLHTSVGLIDDEITFFPPYTQRFSVDIWLGWDLLLRSPKPRTFNLNTEPHLFLPEYLEFHDRQNHRGIVCTLLKQGEQPLGFIGFACCNRKIFSESQLELMQSLAQQATLAIQLTRLAEEAKQAAVAKLKEVIAREQEQAAQERAAELAKANETMRRVLELTARETGINSLVGNVLQAIAEQFEAPIVEWWKVIDDSTVTKQLSYLNGRLYSDEELIGHHGVPEFRVYPETLYFEPMTQRKKHVIGEDCEQLPYPADEIDKIRAWYIANGTRKLLNVPVIVDDKSIGGLVVFLPEDRSFSNSQIEFGWAMSRYIALAVTISTRAEAEKQAAIAREQEQAAQERAEHLARANTALQKTVNALGNIESVEEFIPVVLKIVLENFQATSCAFFEHSLGDLIYLRYWLIEGQVLNPAEILALDPDKYALIIQLAEGFTAPDEYLGTSSRQRTRAVQLDHAAGTCVPEFDDFARACGWETELNVPCVIGNAADGALVIYRGAGLPYSEAEVALAETLSAQLALALQASRLAEDAKQAAIALEQEKAVQERVAELAKANDIMQRTVNRLAVESSLDGFLGFLVSEIALQLGTDTAVITPYDPCTDRLWIAAVISDGKLDMLDPMMSSLPYPNTRFLKRLLNAEGFCIFDVEEDADLFWPGAVEYLQTRGKRKSVSFVIRIGEEFFGQISLAYDTVPNFSLEQTALVQALSTQAALAIQLTRSAEEAKQAAIAREQEKAAQERVTQLAIANNTLKKTLDVLATEPDLDRTLGHILKVTSEQLRSYSSALWLYKPESDRFWLHLVYLDGEVIVATPETAHRLTGQWIYKRDLSRDLALKQHIHDRVPVLYDLDDHPDITKWQRQYLKRLGVRSMLGIPLLLSTEIVGSFTIRFGDRRDFQAEELEFVHALANQATLAIQLLRMAYHKQQAAIVEERNRMARDIHDSLAQSLTGVVMQLNAATEFLTSQPHQTQACITRAQNLAKQGLTEARRSVWLLYQSDPTACSLPDSLTQLSEQMTCGKDISIRMSIDGKPYDLDTPVSLNLLRIAQESLTNALRHAKPQIIYLQLAYTPQQIQLRVQDDGCGFDPHQTVGHGFGLTGMGDRAKVIGAQLQIQSKLGVGTEILVTVPISSL